MLYWLLADTVTLRVQVPNHHILLQDNYYYPKPKYLIIGYMDPLSKERRGVHLKWLLRH